MDLALRFSQCMYLKTKYSFETRVFVVTKKGWSKRKAMKCIKMGRRQKIKQKERLGLAGDKGVRDKLGDWV